MGKLEIYALYSICFYRLRTIFSSPIKIKEVIEDIDKTTKLNDNDSCFFVYRFSFPYLFFTGIFSYNII